MRTLRQLCLALVLPLTLIAGTAGCDLDAPDAGAVEGASDEARTVQVSLDLYTAADEHVGTVFDGPAANASAFRDAVLNAVAQAGPATGDELAMAVGAQGPVFGPVGLSADSVDEMIDGLGSIVMPLAAEHGFESALIEEGAPGLSSRSSAVISRSSTSGETLSACRCVVRSWRCKTLRRCIAGWGCWDVRSCRWVCVQEHC